MSKTVKVPDSERAEILKIIDRHFGGVVGLGRNVTIDSEPAVPPATIEALSPAEPLTPDERARLRALQDKYDKIMVAITAVGHDRVKAELMQRQAAGDGHNRDFVNREFEAKRAGFKRQCRDIARATARLLEGPGARLAEHISARVDEELLKEYAESKALGIPFEPSTRTKVLYATREALKRQRDRLKQFDTEVDVGGGFGGSPATLCAALSIKL
jgi:hypothetical protein